jgi:hypothetical protein
MTAILYDSRTSRKSAKPRPFGHGIEPPSSPSSFEPTAVDRQWWAQQYADRFDRGTTELNHVEKTAGEIGDRLEAARLAIKNIEAIFSDTPTDNTPSVPSTTYGLTPWLGKPVCKTQWTASRSSRGQRPSATKTSTS